MLNKVWRVEQEEQYLHLLKCNQQGQCLRREEEVIDRKKVWKEMWQLELGRLNFLLKSTYDMLQTSDNLMRWKISVDN